ncbi:MAG: rhodanese-like domain-containing protein [Legionella sp.]
MKTITASELKTKLENDDVLLIDVREPEEYNIERIDGAYLIPLGQISIEQLPTTNKPIVIHCHSGKRSADACAKLLKDMPSLDVSSLEGGIIAWRNDKR